MAITDREVAPLNGLTVNVPGWSKDDVFLARLNDPANPVFTCHIKVSRPVNGLM